MGNCYSVRDNDDRKVGEEIDKDRNNERKVKKLLLLGAGGSGKSTLFKQLQNILGTGFTISEKKSFKPQIYEQILEAMNFMIGKCHDLATDNRNEDDEDEDEDENDIKGGEKYRIADENMGSVKIISGTRKDLKITPDLAKHLTALWGDPAIKAVFCLRNKICIPDSTGYFLDNLDRISQEEYIPDDNDLLLVRYRTTGMTEKDFEVKGSIFKICDVGGQRNERRKWMHFFDGVTAVIFVASLSSYDEVVFEDESANSMMEGLSVFSEQCNSITFKLTAFILFLNKSDIFKEKITKTKLTVCWPEYDGGDDYESTVNFIKQKFSDCNQNPNERRIYTHVTCATDTEAFRKIFNDVQHIIINWSLERSGIL